MEQKQNNKLPNNRLQPKKNRRFSFSWFYTALFVFLIGAFLWSSPQADSKKVTYSEFQQQIEAGNVEAVVVYSSKKAEATLKQDSTEQAEDKAIQQKKKIHTQIISEEGFEAFLEKAKLNMDTQAVLTMRKIKTIWACSSTAFCRLYSSSHSSSS